MIKELYRHSMDYADKNGARSHWMDSAALNQECARAIEAAIKDSNHALYRYDLLAASQKVVAEYGKERVFWVLATTLKNKDYDGRFSQDNHNWVKGFDLPSDKNLYYTVETHPAVLDGFIRTTRKVIAEQEPPKHKEPDR
ncbi:MAG: DUF3849 domain-containing protein [Peptococcaceae bacterium]|nr:DUF3849 domain-containing protein [Peptococcaceae bacterium]